MRGKLSFVITVATAILSGCGPQNGGPAVDLQQEEAALRAVSSSWQGFDNEQNAAAVAGLFAPNGVLVWEQRQPVSGPDAVEAFLAEFYAFNPGNETSWGPDRYDIAASGDLAVEHGTFEGPAAQGRYMTVYRKVGGDWKVAGDMSMSTRPNGGAPQWAADLLSEWYEAFNARDAQRLANTYSPDARIRDAQGRQAIIARFESDWAEKSEECSGGFDGFQTVGSIGVGWGRDTCTVTTSDNGPKTTSRGTWVAVYEQQPNGSWLCIRDMGEAVEEEE